MKTTLMFFLASLILPLFVYSQNVDSGQRQEILNLLKSVNREDGESAKRMITSAGISSKEFFDELVSLVKTKSFPNRYYAFYSLEAAKTNFTPELVVLMVDLLLDESDDFQGYADNFLGNMVSSEENSKAREILASPEQNSRLLKAMTDAKVLYVRALSAKFLSRTKVPHLPISATLSEILSNEAADAATVRASFQAAREIGVDGQSLLDKIEARNAKLEPENRSEGVRATIAIRYALAKAELEVKKPSSDTDTFLLKAMKSSETESHYDLREVLANRDRFNPEQRKLAALALWRFQAVRWIQIQDFLSIALEDPSDDVVAEASWPLKDYSQFGESGIYALSKKLASQFESSKQDVQEKVRTSNQAFVSRMESDPSQATILERARHFETWVAKEFEVRKRISEGKSKNFDFTPWAGQWKGSQIFCVPLNGAERVGVTAKTKKGSKEFKNAVFVIEKDGTYVQTIKYPQGTLTTTIDLYPTDDSKFLMRFVKEEARMANGERKVRDHLSAFETSSRSNKSSIVLSGEFLQITTLENDEGPSTDSDICREYGGGYIQAELVRVP